MSLINFIAPNKACYSRILEIGLIRLGGTGLGLADAEAKGRFRRPPDGGGSSGVARQPVTFFIRYAHPTGRLAGAQQTALSTAKKSHQKMP